MFSLNCTIHQPSLLLEHAVFLSHCKGRWYRYRDAIFPDMNSRFDVDEITAPIMYVNPTQDAGSVEASSECSDIRITKCGKNYLGGFQACPIVIYWGDL